MDPTGGINPSNPQLDGVVPPAQPQVPVQPQQPVVGQPSAMPTQITPPSIDAVPAVDPMQQTMAPSTMPTGFDDSMADVQLPEKQSSGKAKKILLIVLAALVVLGLIGGAYFAGYSVGKTKGESAATASYQKKLAELQKDQAESDDASADTTSELDLGTLQDPKYVDETIDGEIGKQVSASDGFVLKVTNIERNYKTTDSNYKLDSSKELVKVNFLIGNAAKDKPKDISSFNFRLENSSGAQLTPENIAEYPGKFDTIKLDVGAQNEGSIIYAVNKDEKPLKFIRSQTYRITSDNKEVTTKIVVTVAQ